jgi:hypothetical protein
MEAREKESDDPGAVKYTHPLPFQTKVKFSVKIVEEPQNLLQNIYPLTLIISEQMLFAQMSCLLNGTKTHKSITY